MRRIIKLIGIISILVVVTSIIGCKLVKSTKGEEDVNNISNYILGTKKSKDNSLDLYFSEKDYNFKKILDNVDENSFSYIENTDEFIAKSNNKIVSIKNGNKEVIGSDVESFNTQCATTKCAVSTRPYKLSDDKSTMAYSTKSGELYIKRLNNKAIKVTDNIEILDTFVYESNYKLSNDGKYIYYLDVNKNLLVINDKLEQIEINKDISYYEISKNGIYVYFIKNNGTVGAMDLAKQKIIEINPEIIKDPMEIKVFDDGNAFITKYNPKNDWENDAVVDLYYYNSVNGKLISVAKDVLGNIYNRENYIIENNNFYYLTSDNRLLKKTVEGEAKEVIKDVDAFKVFKGDIYYINRNTGDLFKIYNGKKEVLDINKNKNTLDFKMEILDENNIGILTNNKDLYINHEKIDKNVEYFVQYKGNIAYYKENNELYTFRVNKREKALRIKNIRDYTNIYYGDIVLYDEDKSKAELET